MADEPQAADDAKAEVVADVASEEKKQATVEVPAELIERLLERLANEPGKPETVQVTDEPGTLSVSQQGRTVGVLNKYPIDPDYYPSPVDFLMSLPTLSRFNLPENYELTWQVKGTQYETKWGTWIQEPRFVVTLYRKAFDDDGNPIEGRRYLVKEGWFTEDEALARGIAADIGIDINRIDVRGLLNQVRMKRFQSWLEEIFKPRGSMIRPATRKETVIGGIPVVVEEYEKEV